MCRRGTQLIVDEPGFFDKQARCIRRVLAVVGIRAGIGFIDDAPLDARVFEAYVIAGELVECFQKRSALFARYRGGGCIGLSGHDRIRRRRDRYLGRRLRLGLRAGLGQVRQRVERVAAAAATDLACGLFKDLGRHAERKAALGTLGVHKLALTPCSADPRPRLVTLGAERRLV